MTTTRTAVYRAVIVKASRHIFDSIPEARAFAEHECNGEDINGVPMFNEYGLVGRFYYGEGWEWA